MSFPDQFYKHESVLFVAKGITLSLAHLLRRDVYATPSKKWVVIKGTTDEGNYFKFGMPRPRKLLKRLRRLKSKNLKKRLFKIAEQGNCIERQIGHYLVIAFQYNKVRKNREK